MNNRLAIVIPAYKADFFGETLQSLANQSDKRFNIYIGDDCSPDDLKSVLDNFSDRLDFKYKRFKENMGGHNLVGHWSRCLDMIADEEFVCIFSDDDIMEKDCVKSFYECLESAPDYDVYHFDLKIIDKAGKILRTLPAFPTVLSSPGFFEELYHWRIDARMPEFIFRTGTLKTGGLISFPRAFRSDNAIVMNCAVRTGIKTVPSYPDASIRWRDSGQNMSSSTKPENMMEHSRANIEFFNWAHRFFRKNRMHYPLSYKYERNLIIEFPLRLYPVYNTGTLLRHLSAYRPGNIIYKLKLLWYFLKKVRH